MNSISGHFDEVGRLYSEADKEMTSNLTTSDGAMYGDGATKFLAAWDENSGTLDDFIKSFDTWAYAVGKINTQFYQFDAGVYKVRDDVDPEKDAEITRTARAFHTTALKTTSGQAGFNEAQAAYEEAYKDGEPMKYYDENGVPYTSIKRIENGKIVEDRVYKTEDGEEKYKVEEHWDWDNEKGEFASSNEYYIGSSKTNNKEEFDDEYYKTYGDEISDYYHNKYMQKYYAGELTEEEKNAIPPQVKDEVMRRLKQDKEMIMAVNNGGEVVFDENGNITDIVYTDKDGKEYKITYGQDENGQPKVTYTGPDGEIDEEAFNTALEEAGLASNKPPLRTGNGIIGGDGKAEDPVVEVTNGNIYEIVTEGAAAKITANGKEYTAHFNSDGTVTYTDSDGNEVTDERLKKGLTDAMYGLDERNKARAGVIEKDGEDTITYTQKDNGTVTVEKRVGEHNPYHTETITYNENNEVSKRHITSYQTDAGEPIKEKIDYERTIEYDENGNVRHENEDYYYYRYDGTVRGKTNYSTEIVGDYSKIEITVYGEKNNIIKGKGTRYVDRNSGLYYSEVTYNSSGKTVYESGFCYRKDYGKLSFENKYKVDKETYEKGVKEITEAKQPAEEQQGGQQGNQDEKGN